MSQKVEKFNQHFLEDETILERIIFVSGVDLDETVLEIGPGRGQLTSYLVQAAGKVIAFELDRDLRTHLDALCAQHSNLTVNYQDATKARLPTFDRLVANIPFNITEPLVTRLFDKKFKSATLLVGERYGRACTTPNPETRLGLLTQAYFAAEYMFTVPSEMFNPEPATDCAVITLEPRSKSKLPTFALYTIRCLWDQKSRTLKDATHSAVEQYLSHKSSVSGNSSKVVSKLFGTDRLARLANSRVCDLSNDQLRDFYFSLEGLNHKRAFGGHKPRGGARNWKQQYGEYL